MGYLMAIGPCIGCGRAFTFNPDRVPSSSAITGKREPICADCVERINPQRIAHGLEPIVPLPGAYDAGEVAE
jgi:hypothetical protein